MKLFLDFADNRRAGSLADNMRQRRFRLFMSLVSQMSKPLTILDIGGREDYWESMGFSGSKDYRILLVNLKAAPVSLPNMRSVVGDARDLSKYADNEFDIAYSNSVIEHLFTWEAQVLMAQEVQRVSKCHFIQTPNRLFPIEPHYHLPLFQFLPLSVRVYLLTHFELGFLRRKVTDKEEATRLAKEIRLLTKTELRGLFPNSSIYSERIFGVTKSFVAYGGWEGHKGVLK